MGHLSYVPCDLGHMKGGTDFDGSREAEPNNHWVDNAELACGSLMGWFSLTANLASSDELCDILKHSSPPETTFDHR